MKTQYDHCIVYQKGGIQYEVFNLVYNTDNIVRNAWHFNGPWYYINKDKNCKAGTGILTATSIEYILDLDI